MFELCVKNILTFIVESHFYVENLTSCDIRLH